MTHRYCVEALDRSPRDITHNKLFGGRTILFSGDWRQIGPISKVDTPTEVVDSAVISSPLWQHVNRFRLTKSQRDTIDPQYVAFVQNIGEDKITPVTMADGQTLIPLNNHSNANSHEHLQLQSTTDFDELINFVYPDMTEDARLWNDRAILATTNATIDKCNESISLADQDNRCLFSAQILLFRMNTTQARRSQHLNTFSIFMFQAYTLGMLVRNLNFSGLVKRSKVCSSCHTTEQSCHSG